VPRPRSYEEASDLRRIRLTGSHRTLDAMLKPRVFALWIVVAVFPSAACVGQGVNLSVGGGGGDLGVDTAAAISNGGGDEDTFVGELGVGYRFANNVVIEGSGSTGFNVTALLLGGSYEFQEARVMAGYAFPVTEKLRLVPTAGVSVWQLEAVESPLLFFVPFARRTTSGSDLAWRLAGEYYFNQRLGAYFSYSGTRPDFGRFSLLSFGMKVQF
jgi:hypothetical protein